MTTNNDEFQVETHKKRTESNPTAIIKLHNYFLTSSEIRKKKNTIKYVNFCWVFKYTISLNQVTEAKLEASGRKDR